MLSIVGPIQVTVEGVHEVQKVVEKYILNREAGLLAVPVEWRPREALPSTHNPESHKLYADFLF